jgi:hypothetical protein
VTNLAFETVRLMQAPADTSDSLRRLAARIAAAGEDPQLRYEDWPQHIGWRLHMRSTCGLP